MLDAIAGIREFIFFEERMGLHGFRGAPREGGEEGREGSGPWALAGVRFAPPVPSLAVRNGCSTKRARFKGQGRTA